MNLAILSGFINLHKPLNLTSHDCVARVKRLLQMVGLKGLKVGHGGTLDPAATGVLPIAIGSATRLLQFLSLDKAYWATVRLGVRTETDDLEGAVLAAQAAPWLTLADVSDALRQFEGTIQQIPPRYSAIQVQGKRLYELARAGEAIEVPVRTVEIHDIQLLDWRSGDFPEVDLAIACGKGTYIRSIARDLGDVLETGGTLAALIRTLSSGFQLSNSITLEELAQQLEEKRFVPIPPAAALQHLPALMLPEAEARRWCQGQRIWLPEAPDTQASTYRIHAADDRFLGVSRLAALEDGWLLSPQVVMLAAL